MIWFGILIGSLMRSVEAVNGVMFTVLFPITFLANTFAPDRADAALAAGDRRVESGVVAGAGHAGVVGQRWTRAAESAQLPLHHPVLATILWSLALTAVFAPFALRAYARRTGG